MNIHIENAETLEYLTSSGSWTRNVKKAEAFKSSTLAKKTGSLAAIGKFNVVGAFNNSPQLTNLDVGCGTHGEAVTK
jgi:hypothetical protein